MKQTTIAKPWSIMVGSTALTALLSTSLTATAQAPYEVVWVQGTMSGSEDMFFEDESTGSANPWGVLDETCSDLDRAFKIGLDISAAENDPVVREFISGLGFTDDGSVVRLVSDWYEGICYDRGPESSFNIIYSRCSMTMWSQGSVLRFVLPAGGGDAVMRILSLETEPVEKPICEQYASNPINSQCEDDPLAMGTYTDFDAQHIVMRTVNLERVMQSQYVPKGRSTDFEITPGGSGEEHLGVPTRRVGFKYEGTMNPMTMDAVNSAGSDSGEFPMGQIKLISEGTAYVNSDDVPGAHIVSDFYTNLEQQVVPNSQAESLFGAMFRHMSGIMTEGFPLSLEQETAVRIEGMSQMMVPTLGKKSFSEMKVSGVGHFLSNAEWCAVGDPPADWKVVTMDDLFTSGEANGAAPAAGSAGPPGMGMSPEQSAEVAQAMQQFEEAMAGMSEEERQMLQQMGMGGMMQQAPAANPAAQSAGTTSGRSDMPSSDELYSDDLIQMVQNHLDALGYDTGNTSGEMSLETMIAISQFQAERGLEVTGEVSPQLAGLLSAEVDKRR